MVLTRMVQTRVPGGENHHRGEARRNLLKSDCYLEVGAA